MVRRLCVSVVGSLLLLMGASLALAHGELERTDPEAGAVLKAPPAEVSIDLTETPTDASNLKVLDGCGRNVIEQAEVKGKSLVASIQEAQPGAWLASWRILSDEDGHVTNGSITFRVRGAPDCSAKTTPKAQEPPAESSSSIDPTAIFLIVGGSVVIIGLALLVRRSS